MRIYLAQHGLAVAEEVDPARPLSPQGHQDLALIGGLLEQAGVRVAAVVHSGKTRAEQTAAALARSVMPGGRIEARAGLHPKDAVGPVAKWVDGLGVDTLVVGHQPLLGRLASVLLTGDPERVTLAFEPGSVACLERDPAQGWRLLWMVRPELLRAPGA